MSLKFFIRLRTIKLIYYLTILMFLVVLVCYNAKNQDFLPLAFGKSNRPYPAATTSCITGRPCTYPEVVDLRIIVITFTRAASLSKLLCSLDTLVLDGDRAALEIWIDRDRKGDVNQRTVEVASAFNWTGGTTRVHIQTRSAGIMGQWIDTWRPQDDTDTELAVIIEDDIIVSPYAYRWLRAVHRTYTKRSDFAGTSLMGDELKVLSPKPKSPLAAPKNDTVFMYKCLGTWGFSPKPLHWRRFQDWVYQHQPSLAPHFRPYVPDALPTKWYQQFERSGRQNDMWEMWFIHYMHIEQLYTIYSNLNVYTDGKENCLCINRREPGLHYKRKGSETLCRLMTVWKEEYVDFPKDITRLHWDGLPMGDHLY